MNQHINAAAVIADLRQGALRLETEALRIRSTIATLIDLYGDPDAMPEGYVPPPMFYPPERNPELRTGTKSTAASVSEPLSGKPMQGKDASRTIPQVSHADNREAVTDPHRESGETNSGAIGGRQLQPALRTGVASGAVDTHSENVPEQAQAGEAEADPAPNSQAKASVGNADTAAAKGSSAVGSGDASRLSDGSGTVAPIPHAADALPVAATELPRPVAASHSPHRRTGLSDGVRRLHREHPDWTATDIAEALDTTDAYVRKTAYRLELVLPRAKRGPKSPAVAAKPTPAPKAPTAPAPPATVKPAAIAEAPRPTRPMPVANGPVRRPSGKLFWLRNPATGEYLGRFCDRLVSDKREAWTGTQEQLVKCRRAFVAARDLTERPVEIDQPAARGTM